MRTYQPVGIRHIPCEGCGETFEASRSDAKWCTECRWTKTHTHNSRPRPERTAGPVQTRLCSRCNRIWETRRNAKHPICYICRENSKYDSCPDCGKRKSKTSIRCNVCHGKTKKGLYAGERNPFYRGGVTYHSRGYRFVLDPRPNPKHRYVAEHRLVWEEAKGPIPRGHVIHHINGDKLDNRLENFACLSNTEHALLHQDDDQQRSRYIQALESRIRELEGTPDQ